ncbi:golgin subfamily A member 2 [Ceratitis capitata]|uniref:golgin subfamily A member 2 n=1 Tax=Ceratitis capitata TaxID=7213 RepID=UPI0003297EF2|nr:golgin subfamily A member 2 [Ceratitis capitata]
MPVEEASESKAQKLAAARKKLREYQKRSASENVTAVVAHAAPTESHGSSITGGSSISSNISEASDCEMTTNGNEATTASLENINENCSTTNAAATEFVQNTTSTAPVFQAPALPTAASYFSTIAADGTASALDGIAMPTAATNAVIKDAKADQLQLQNVNAIQVLISEKAALTSDLNKYRSLSRERELELEELRTQLESALKRQDDLTQRYQTQQQGMELLRKTNAELQHKLAQANAQQEDQAGHLDELKRLLDNMQQRAVEIEHQFKEKSNELEMAQLRIRQLSDEASVNQVDNRVESLTQNQFMYEQQIRDLQAMVQQLTYDKEQANNQYQSYVQHLNAEITNLSEKNTELMDESTKQQERERQLVEHISILEKDIQKNISRQDLLRKEKEKENAPDGQQRAEELQKLKEQISDYELERHEFQLKIKSQEDRLDMLNNELLEKQTSLEELYERMRHYANIQPDQTKLLATMESDKIAASRALSQNVELKRQLDELEMRFVQLTNDKADLMNKLDAEEHTNREMRTNYADMEERLQSIDERFKFKDEEMIRLSHENMELKSKTEVLQRRLRQQGRSKNLTKTGEDEENDNQDELTDDQDDNLQEHDDEKHEHKHNGCDDQHEHEHEHEHNHHEHEHEHEHDHGHHEHEHEHDHGHHEHEHEHVHGAAHTHSTDLAHHHNHQHVKKISSSSSTPYLPTEEAVEKLEQRFTRLMSQVADLTDEKQRLEHLVLQLQGETETIGEYITLYQTQRRMLKQREYEKAAQMQLLQREREQLRERIAILNNLVHSLSTDLPHSTHRLPENFNTTLNTDNNAEANINADTQPLIAVASEAQEDQHLDQQQLAHSNAQQTANESRQILTKIQNIITEINENSQHIPDVATAQTVDHLNCCLGKVEVV